MSLEIDSRQAHAYDASAPSFAPVHTHWTRILHCDLFARDTGDCAPDQGEMTMAAQNSNHDTGSERMRSPFKQAAILLGIYIGMYLAVAGVVRVLPMLGAPTASASTSAAGVGQRPASDTREQASEHADY